MDKNRYNLACHKKTFRNLKIRKPYEISYEISQTLQIFHEYVTKIFFLISKP